MPTNFRPRKKPVFSSIYILHYETAIRPFSKLRKLANCQLVDCNRQINCHHWAKNIPTNKQLRMNKHKFNPTYSKVIQSLNPLENFIWPLKIVINVSVAICHLPIRQFFHLEKSLF